MGENLNVFFLSLVEKGKDAASLPRTDVLSISLAGFPEATASGLGQSEAHDAFESFCRGLLASWDGSSLESGGEETSSYVFRNTKFQLLEDSLHCSTETTLPARGNRPSLEVAIRLEGQGETGLVAVRFAPEGLPEEEVRMLDDILEGISFCP